MSFTFLCTNTPRYIYLDIYLIEENLFKAITICHLICASRACVTCVYIHASHNRPSGIPIRHITGERKKRKSSVRPFFSIFHPPPTENKKKRRICPSTGKYWQPRRDLNLFSFSFARSRILKQTRELSRTNEKGRRRRGRRRRRNSVGVCICVGKVWSWTKRDTLWDIQGREKFQQKGRIRACVYFTHVVIYATNHAIYRWISSARYI